jgi:hypothetical protein
LLVRAAQKLSGALSQPMRQCLLQESINWYRHAASNTNALDDCYVDGTQETAQPISVLGRLEDNGSGTPAPSPWIKTTASLGPAAMSASPTAISVRFPNQGPQRAVP